jgi:hypothetical protein
MIRQAYRRKYDYNICAIFTVSCILYIYVHYEHVRWSLIISISIFWRISTMWLPPTPESEEVVSRMWSICSYGCAPKIALKQLSEFYPFSICKDCIRHWSEPDEYIQSSTRNTDPSDKCPSPPSTNGKFWRDQLKQFRLNFEDLLATFRWIKLHMWFITEITIRLLGAQTRMSTLSKPVLAVG